MRLQLNKHKEITKIKGSGDRKSVKWLPEPFVYTELLKSHCFGAEQVLDPDAEEVGYIREQLFFFRNLIAVLPVGDGSVHEVEDLVTAGPGYAFLFSEDPEFCSE